VPGIIVGSLGVAAIGAGVWMWVHGDGSSPVIAIDSSHAVVGWAGRF
jgi:hypothetical protein